MSAGGEGPKSEWAGSLANTVSQLWWDVDFDNCFFGLCEGVVCKSFVKLMLAVGMEHAHDNRVQPTHKSTKEFVFKFEPFGKEC